MRDHLQTRKKLWIGTPLLLMASYIGLLLYSMRTMHIEELILCSAAEGGIHIPDFACRYYMIHHRMTKTDIDALTSGGGLDYVLNADMSRPHKFATANAFLSHGLDIDGINHYGNAKATPLQAAVIYNDPERVRFLISRGADITIANNKDMTALELAQKLHSPNGPRDRSEIINILTQEQDNLISK